jgi:hypothetical protein
MTKRWNTLRVSAWGFWVGLIYGVVDQFFLSDYEDDFLSENTVSSIGPIVWAAVCGAVLLLIDPTTSRKTAGLESAKKVPVTDGRHGQFREENDFGRQA